MASKPITLHNQAAKALRMTGTACALTILSALAGCDQRFAVDPFTDYTPTGGTVGIDASAAGGAAGSATTPAALGGSQTAPVEGTGGVSGAPGGTGGATRDAGGETQATPLPAGCAPISTTPSVVDPCGHAFGVAYSPDGQLLAMGGDDTNPSVHVWRLADGMPLANLAGQGPETTYSVAFSPDSKILAAGGYYNDGSNEIPWVRLWDVATGTLIHALRPNTGWYVDSVAFSNDGSMLLTGGFNGAVELWRVADGTQVLGIPVSGTAHNVHFSPDNTKLIIATTDGKARVYDATSGALVLGPLDIASEMADAEMAPDGTQLATTWQSGNDDNSVRIYDASTGALVQSLAGHNAYISRVVWIDQSRIVSDDWEGIVILWQRGSDGRFAQAKSWSTGGQSLGIGVSPDKTTIITGGDTNNAGGFVFLTL